MLIKVCNFLYSIFMFMNIYFYFDMINVFIKPILDEKCDKSDTLIYLIFIKINIFFFTIILFEYIRRFIFN